MRLRDRLATGREERLDPEVERELAAVDAGLAGLAVREELADVAELAAMVRDERPGIDAELAALLDERAAAGFPRPAAARHRPARVVQQLRAVPPRRLIAPAGAVATAVVLTGVAIVALGGGGGGSGEIASLSSAPAHPGGSPSRSNIAGGAGAGSQFSLHAPSAQRPAARASGSFGALAPAQDAATSNRKVARNANLTLSTDPSKVRTVADGVVQVTRRYHGLVISSRITSGKGTPPRHGGPVPTPIAPFGSPAGAEFQLRIPAAKLELALDDLSHLGLVVSRTEGSQDITGRFNSARQRIASLTSERDVLISRLSSAVTTEAIDTIKHRLAVVRRLLVRAQNQLGQLNERVRMVPVHVSVTARGAGAGAGGGGSFGIGDALHDAGRVLTVAAGVLLISLAVAAPLGILAALAWLAARSAFRWRRERALEGEGI